MEKQFVPYELAVKLKELGFDEPCFGIYDGRDCKIDSSVNTVYFSNPPYNKEEDSDKHKKYSNSLLYRPSILAPLWQQAFDWLREKHNMHSNMAKTIDELINLGFKPYYIGIHNNGGCDYETYEYARLACREKLIELTTPSTKG